MLIAIPSKSRPFKSPSKELLKSAVLFVPENEYNLYKKVYNDIIPVPSDIKGITRTRNWILQNYKNEDIVFVDDDLKSVGYFYTDQKSFKRIHKKITNSDILIEEFHKFFELTRSLNFKIWGLKTEDSNISYFDHNPFSFKRYITASCMGIVNDTDFYFDETFPLKEDYEIGLRSIITHGGVLAINFIYWQNDHWSTNGGCGDYRTHDLELQCIKKLKNLYPDFVKEFKLKNSHYTIKLMF